MGDGSVYAGALSPNGNVSMYCDALRRGPDIRTIQQWMGHRDIVSTMVYLKGVRNSDIQVRLNKGSLAAFA
jgi:integrase